MCLSSARLDPITTSCIVQGHDTIPLLPGLRPEDPTIRLVFILKRSQSSRSSSKISSEKALAAFVSFAGFESSMPCTNCFRNGRSCIISSGLSRCGECIDRKVHCDGNNFAPFLMRSIEEVPRLDAEEEKLREQVLALNTQLLSTMSRKRRARERAGELFRRGMVDHEKEVPDPRDPPAPASQASGNDHPPSTSAAVGTPDWLADVDWSSVDPDLLLGQADLGSVGGTAGASPGSSGAREVPTS